MGWLNIKYHCYDKDVVAWHGRLLPLVAERRKEADKDGRLMHISSCLPDLIDILSYTLGIRGLFS